MNYSWNDDQIRIYEKILNAAPDFVKFQGNKTSLYSEPWQLCAKLGLCGLAIPIEYGGSGLDSLTTAYAMEAFGKASFNSSLIFAVGAHQYACAIPIYLYGSKKLKNEFLFKLCNGINIGANAMTESIGGSDVASLQTSAIYENEHYVLSGEKCYVTNAPYADIFIVYARTNPQGGFLGISAFVVKKETPGLKITYEYLMKGMEGVSVSKIQFNNCQIAKEYLLGKEGEGLKIFHHSMDWERTCMFSGFMGLIDHELEKVIEFTKKRKVSDKLISKHQAVSHKLANIILQSESTKQLIYKACFLLKEKRPAARLFSAMAKLAASETYTNFAHCATQVYAGLGCDKSHRSSDFLNDSSLLTILSGTSDIMRNIIWQESVL